MDKDEEIKRRMADLANICYKKGIYTHTGFLSMADQAAFFDIERELSFIPHEFFGGMKESERRMLRFGSEDTLGYSEPFPISCIKAVPAAPKFADELTHRDFLGALMNLGIERDCLGDIVVRENHAYIFCEEKMAGYISAGLDKVKHTIISCEIASRVPDDAGPSFSEEEYTADSPRADAVIAKVYKLSRSKSLELFRAKRVFVNGRLTENNSASLKSGDTVSVRGFGKFIFCGIICETRKNRERFLIKRYI